MIETRKCLHKIIVDHIVRLTRGTINSKVGDHIVDHIVPLILLIRLPHWDVI